MSPSWTSRASPRSGRSPASAVSVSPPTAVSVTGVSGTKFSRVVVRSEEADPASAALLLLPGLGGGGLTLRPPSAGAAGTRARAGLGPGGRRRLRRGVGPVGGARVVGRGGLGSVGPGLGRGLGPGRGLGSVGPGLGRG